jgi:hypothetical protein
MLTKKIAKKRNLEHYAHNTNFKTKSGKVFQDFENGQK